MTQQRLSAVCDHWFERAQAVLKRDGRATTEFVVAALAVNMCGAAYRGTLGAEALPHCRSGEPA